MFFWMPSQSNRILMPTMQNCSCSTNRTHRSQRSTLSVWTNQRALSGHNWPIRDRGALKWSRGCLRSVQITFYFSSPAAVTAFLTFLHSLPRYLHFTEYNCDKMLSSVWSAVGSGLIAALLVTAGVYVLGLGGGGLCNFHQIIQHDSRIQFTNAHFSEKLFSIFMIFFLYFIRLNICDTWFFSDTKW